MMTQHYLREALSAKATGGLSCHVP